MSRSSARVGLALLAFAASAGVALSLRAGSPPNAAPPGAAASAGNAKAPRISGPYVYENLDVYLVHGDDAGANRTLTPLSRALAERKVVVRETGNVNQLEVENLSDEEVFIQAGEIVKGGRQDRVLGSDMLLPPKSGRIALRAHCVEQGRWSARGAEASDRFSTSHANASDKALKMANLRGEQGQVWANVSKVQRQLQSNVGADVRSQESASSLQLTMENERVRKSVEGYVKALRGILDTHADAVGCAFAINGALNSAEVYGSHALFAGLWPKLIDASAVEAVSERKGTAAHTPPSLDAVRAMLAEAEKPAGNERAAGPAARAISKETEKSLMVETRETRTRRVVHKTYVAK